MGTSPNDEVNADGQAKGTNSADLTGQEPPESESENESGHYPPDEELFRTYVGPNADRFMKVYRGQTGGKPALSFNWVVLLAALPWLFYRKLYLVGIAVLLVPIILVVIFPNLAGVGSIGVASALAVSANMIYVTFAIRRIGKLKAQNLSPDELTNRLRRAGGTSPAGAGFGTLIVLSIVALPFLNSALATLPECDDEQIQDFAKKMVTDAVSKEGVRAEDVTVSDFAPFGTEAEDDRRRCSFTLNIGSSKAVFYLTASWTNRFAGEYRMQVSAKPDVSNNKQ